MQHGDRCPCCFDTEHQNAPLHEIMSTQIFDTTPSGIVYMARYYYCPITQELYEDEELAEINRREMLNAAERNGEGATSG